MYPSVYILNSRASHAPSLFSWVLSIIKLPISTIVIVITVFLIIIVINCYVYYYVGLCRTDCCSGTARSFWCRSTKRFAILLGGCDNIYAISPVSYIDFDLLHAQVDVPFYMFCVLPNIEAEESGNRGKG